MRKDAWLWCVALALTCQNAAFATSVFGTVAAPARHAIYLGTADGTDLELVGSNDSATPATVSVAPQQYRFEMPDQRFIYLVVWANAPTASGVLAEFYFNGLAVVSGDPAWQVYLTPLRLAANDPVPRADTVGEQIRTATRRFAWEKATRSTFNLASTGNEVAELSTQTAWMWSPANAADPTAPMAPPRPADCVVFRICPAEIWPEIEWSHEHNVGTGPMSAAAERYNSDLYPSGGGGSGGGGSSAWSPSGYTTMRSIDDPFTTWNPPGSYSSPPTVVTSEPSNPIVPSRTPEVPEPSSALLLLASLGGLGRGRRSGRPR